MLMVPEAGAREEAAGREAEVLAASFDVSLAFRGKPVIEHVSVAVHPSEIVTLIGPNGAGKTTLAKMLLGLVTPSSGKVTRRKACASAMCRSASWPTGTFRSPCGASCR